MNNVNKYQQLALITENKNTPKDLRLVNGVLGLVGEAGECTDLLKKHLFQQHELDKKRLMGELGDIAWYLALCADALGADLSTILGMNIDKLKKRYPEGFDVDKSLHRVDGDV